MDEDLLKRMYLAYMSHKSSDAYKNFKRNEKLFSGKSAQVFSKDVINRVKLEYMGIVHGEYGYHSYDVVEGTKAFITQVKDIRELIVGNPILKSVTRLYAELASNKPPVLSIAEGKESFLEGINIQSDVEEQIALQSYAGKYLLKGIFSDKEISYVTIAPVSYFKVPNIIDPQKADAFVKFYESKRKTGVKNKSQSCIDVEIYTEGKTEYRKFTVGADSFQEVQYGHNLSPYGLTADGLGYIQTFKGCQVAEVLNIFDTSDYDDDLIRANKELVIGDTITSQAFDKIANPLLQVPESMIETNDKGEDTVMINDRVAVLQNGDAEIKQVSLESKVDEYKVHRDNLYELIYAATGVNETAFGLIKNGTGESSGESKRRALERVLSTVESKRANVLKAISKVLNWAYAVNNGDSLDLTLKGQDIISLSVQERVNIATTSVEKGIMSIESAVEYINLTDISTEEELERLKKDPGYMNKVTDLLSKLMTASRDERIRVSLEGQVNELITELTGKSE